MNYTDIEWTRGADGRKGLTWNPIKGVCPVGCWHCYAKGIYRRFKIDPTPRLDEHELIVPLFWADSGKKIFVCSTFELFHPVADQWRDDIFDVIERRGDMTFIILTKMPERIDRPMPDNVWLGTSVTGAADLGRIDELRKHKASVHFVSFEPLLDNLGGAHFGHGFLSGINWIIIGRLTGHGRKHDPCPDVVDMIGTAAALNNIPVFLKKNLADIAPGFKLVQEFPR
jgi:protein gp37